MIVTCPACTSRYRIRDEKIGSRGARISCPKCDHKFVVHREDEVAAAAGVPVTFARGGQTLRGDFPDEDDEADVPTTVMPHGSQLAQSIKAAAEAQRLQEAREAMARPAAVAAAAPRTVSEPADGGARQLRAHVRPPPAEVPQQQGGGSRSAVLIGAAILAVILVAVLAWSLLPMAQVGGV